LCHCPAGFVAADPRTLFRRTSVLSLLAVGRRFFPRYSSTTTTKPPASTPIEEDKRERLLDSPSQKNTLFLLACLTMAEEKEAKRQSLFDSDDDEEGATAAAPASSDTKSTSNKIKINKKFARDFETRKQKEELRRVRFEGGDEDNDEVGGDDNDDSSSSSEDEDAELLTTKLDVDILKTINALRRKDARIYDPNARFFQEATAEEGDGDDEQPQQNEKKKAKPKRYKDVVREQVLEEMEKDQDNADDDDDADGATEPESSKKTPRLAYDAQQEEYRKAFLESTRDHDGSEEDGDDGDEVIVKRQRKGDDDADDDDDDAMLQQQLLGEIERMKATASKDDKLVDPRGEVEDGEAFLLDYFKNRPWVEKADDDNDSEQDDASNDNYDDNRKLPSTGVRSKATAAVDEDHSDDVSLQELEEADDFEAQYNFRFEQAAAATATGAEHSLQSYARGQTMNTLRRKDESRAEKRRARKERKAMERKAKEEQLKRLKNAKRQEMEDKLRKVKAVLGEVEGRGASVDEAALMKLLEGDFDPEKFEELMKETYNDEFYQREDNEWKDDVAVRESLLKNDEDGKLLVGIDDLDGGLYDNQEEHEGFEGGTGGEEEEEWPDDMEEGAEEEEYPPEESALEQKLKVKVEDELYKLDYEDIVAGMPTRFKYRQVEPNNYGLSTEEILFARDSTLKQFVSLKKMAPYAEQEYFVGSRQRRRFREMLKQDLEEEFGKEAGDETAEKSGDVAISEERKKKKRRRLKKGSKRERDLGETKSEENTGQLPDVDADAATEPPLKAKRKRRKKKNGEPVVDSSSGNADGDGPTDVAAEPVKLNTTAAAADNNNKKKDRAHKKREKRKHKKKTKKHRTIEGVTESRLASYGF